MASATLTVDLQGKAFLEAVFRGNSAEDAKALAAVARAGIDLLRGQYQAIRAQAQQNMRPEMARPLLAVADEILDGLQAATEGERVVVRVERPQGLDQAAKLIAPAIVAARRAAQRAARLNDLHQIGVAMFAYENTEGTFPAAASRDTDGKPLLSWRVHLLPYLDHAELYRQFHLDEPWDSEHNLKLVAKMPEVFRGGGSGDGKTSLLVFTGQGTPFGGKDGPSLGLVLNNFGPVSRTIMVVEAGADKAVPWTKPADLTFNPKDPAAALGELPDGTFPALFFDGHVETLKRDLDVKVLSALIAGAADNEDQ